ncbi:hypothetical protein GOP47_0009596 [Adiantum capillus-veneris]|uniref:Potassium channel domain-containing protein n=1 Tax=Adiantum capillus-veneris TaxID=13818 RepID=A0A9D4ZJT6_ADICA|nr:hypothetical protein GOP47_0009596 [Adiantum capillus-veneris]
MEEPLLCRKPLPQLCVSETCSMQQDQLPACSEATPSSIKDRLIFGSISDSFSCLDFARFPPADPLSSSFRDRNIEQVPDSDLAQSSISLVIEGNELDENTSTRFFTRTDSQKSPKGLPRPPSIMSIEELQGYDAHAAATLEGEHTLDNASRHLFRSRTAPAIFGINRLRSGKVDFNVAAPPALASPMSVVSQAFIGLMLYLSVGMLIYTLRGQEFSGATTNGFFDALYFCIVTMCTIGYGDITPVTPIAKLFSCAFVLVGFGFIDILLSAMVSYVLQKQETLLLNSVAAGPRETAKNYLVDVKKGRMRVRSKVVLAFGVVVMCIGIGTFMMGFLEGLGWLDAFYLSCMSVTTVGYGDHAFKTLSGRVFASVWLLVSTLAVAQSFLYLAEARIDKRHRLIAKWVLEKEMTFADLLAADLDNDGSVRYLIYSF